MYQPEAEDWIWIELLNVGNGCEIYGWQEAKLQELLDWLFCGNICVKEEVNESLKIDDYF